MTNQAPTANPTPTQILEARFEAVKVVLAVAQRVLLDDYERSIIVPSIMLSLKGLQEDYARLTAGDEASEVAGDEGDESAEASEADA